MFRDLMCVLLRPTMFTRRISSQLGFNNVFLVCCTCSPYLLHSKFNRQ